MSNPLNHPFGQDSKKSKELLEFLKSIEIKKDQDSKEPVNQMAHAFITAVDRNKK